MIRRARPGDVPGMLAVKAALPYAEARGQSTRGQRLGTFSADRLFRRHNDCQIQLFTIFNCPPGHVPVLSF